MIFAASRVRGFYVSSGRSLRVLDGTRMGGGPAVKTKAAE